MSKEIRPDYTQEFLFPSRLEDWVPPDHPARFIREFVDEMDLDDLGFRRSPGDDGRPHYATDLLLKVWIYGYYNRICSCRKLEQACMENLSLVWLTGKRAPDHNTLWRFYRDNKAALKGLFKKSARVALGAGLVGFVLHALDGTKIQAAASPHTARHKEDLEKQLQRLDALIDDHTRLIDESHEREDPAAAWRLPQEMQQAQHLRRAVRETLDRMEREDTEHLHPHDQDARMMKTTQGTTFAYNAQVMVDEQSGLIVAQDVLNEANDSHALVPMLEETRETVGATADETLTDGGYASAGQIASAQTQGHETLMPVGPKDAGPYHALNFTYNASEDVVICPRGERLTFEREKPARRGDDTMRVYRCHCGHACPARAACTRDKRGRMIEIGPHSEAVRAQREKLLQKDNRCKLKRRGAIVERVFGAVKEQMRFRRWTVGGLDNVRAQWSLVCTAFNLKKMYGWWTQGKLLPATE